MVRRVSTLGFLILSWFISIGMATAVGSGRNGLGLDDMRIDQENPTVFLTLERVGTREPQREGESHSGVWLRLHNNSRSPIVLAGYGDPHRDLGLCYVVRKNSDKGVGTRITREAYRDTFSLFTIQPGEEVVFSLPKEDLDGSEVCVPFHYGWEKRKDRTFSGEPEHLVCFGPMTK